MKNYNYVAFCCLSFLFVFNISLCQAQGSPSSEVRTSNSSQPEVLGYYLENQLILAVNDPSLKKVRLIAFEQHDNVFTKKWNKLLPGSLALLAGFATDGQFLYFLTTNKEDLSKDLTTFGFRNGVIKLIKTDLEANKIWEKDLNNETYLKKPVFSPMKGGTGALCYGNGKLMIAHAQNTLPDANKIRHQTANYLIVDAESGEGSSQANGQTSWRHSFDQRLLFDGTDFVMMDLADAGWYMPAGGITLRKILLKEGSVEMPPFEQVQGTYIYARLSETARSQNFTFTNMGDICNGAEGYTAIFSSEKHNVEEERNGWEQPIKEPRNIGIVHVVKNFEAVQDGMRDGKQKTGNTSYNGSRPAALNITNGMVDTKKRNRNAEAGGEVINRVDKNELSFKRGSVAWLTNFEGDNNFTSVEKPHLIKIDDNKLVALWEETSVQLGQNQQLAGEPVYLRTKAVLIDEYGNVLKPIQEINARLNKNGSDNIFLIENLGCWIYKNTDGSLTFFRIGEDLEIEQIELQP